MTAKDQANGVQKQTHSAEDEWSRAFDHLYEDDDEPDGADEGGSTENSGAESGEDGQANATDDPADAKPSEGDDHEPSANQNSQSVESDPPDGTESTDDTDGTGGDPQQENPQKSEFAEQAGNILATIQKMDPEVKGFGDLEDVPLFCALLDRGLSPEDAFRQSSPKYRSRESAAAMAASKAHLTPSGENKRTDEVDMSVINQFRAANPKMSKKDAIALYRRVTGK
ncbi:MAG: hypothetical protein ACI3XR_01670 [Eubacteriales bacterium]